jgi:type II secretory pathway component PulF
MIVWAYAIPLNMSLFVNNQELPLMSQLISNFSTTLPIMLIISIPPGAIMGIIGYLITNNMIKSANTNKEGNNINDNSIQINNNNN